MAIVSLSSLGGAGWQFFDDSGIPLAGGKLYSYGAGGSTPLATYTSAAGDTLNPNPIILDAAGRPPEEVWMLAGQIYKFVLKTSADALIRTYDNIPAIASIQGFSYQLDSRAQGLVTDIPSDVNFVITGGYYTAGDGGGAQFKRSSSPLSGLANFQSADGAWWEICSPVLSPLMFGAKGDGATNDAAALSAVLTSGSSVFMPALTFNVDSEIDISNVSDLSVKGVPGGTIITSATARAIFKLSELDSVVFEDVAMNVTTVNAANSTTRGVIYSSNSNLRKVFFKRCSFATPNNAVNGVKLVCDSSTIDNVIFEDCVIVSALRMGIEVQNHGSGTDERYTAVQWIRGSITATQQAISLTGYGRDCVVENMSILGGSIGVENVGCSALKLDHVMFSNVTRALSYTNARTMYDCFIIGCKTTTPMTSTNIVRNCVRLKSFGNYFAVSAGHMSFRHIRDCRFVGDTYKTNGSYALYVEGGDDNVDQGESSDNVWDDCEFDNSDSVSEFVTIRFYDADNNSNTFRNIVRNARITRGSSSNTADNNNGAFNNWIINYSNGDQAGVAGRVTNYTFTADSDIDRSAQASAPLLGSFNCWNITSTTTLTATRTMTLPPYIPAGIVRLKNSTTGGQSIQLTVGSTTTAAIPNGSEVTVYFGNNTIGIL